MMNGTKDPLRPGRAPVLFSVGLHLVVVAAAWWAHSRADVPYVYESIAIEMVSLSDLEALPTVTEEDLVVERPEDAPAPEPEPEPPLPDPEPETRPDPPPPQREPERQPEPVTPPRTETRPPTSTPTPTTSVRTEEASAGNVNLRMEGLRRDYPTYYTRILDEIRRCFRAPGGGNWETTIEFQIERDGMVPGRTIRVAVRSANPVFDMQAVEAVECAGRGRFGPLPADLPWDVLPVRFTFTPAGASGGGDETPLES